MDIKSVFLNILSPRFAIQTYAIPFSVVLAVIGVSNSFTLIAFFHFLGIMVVAYALVGKYCLDLQAKLSIQLFINDLINNPNYWSIRITAFVVISQGVFMDLAFRQLGYGKASLYLSPKDSELALEVILYITSGVSILSFAIFMIPAILLSSMNNRENRVLAITLNHVWFYIKKLLGLRGIVLSLVFFVIALIAHFLGLMTGFTLFCLIVTPLTLLMIAVAIVAVGQDGGIKKFKEKATSKPLSVVTQL